MCSVVPGIGGMWARDLRSTSKKWLRTFGIETAVAMRFMGHKASVHESYDNVDADDLRAAAEALRLKTLAASLGRYIDGRRRFACDSESKVT